MKYWHNVKEDPPMEGKPVLILQTWGEPKDYTTDIAYFCDGAFYYLELDPRLGVLRKTYVNEKVEYWADYIIPPKE